MNTNRVLLYYMHSIHCLYTQGTLCPYIICTLHTVNTNRVQSTSIILYSQYTIFIHPGYTLISYYVHRTHSEYIIVS